MTRKEARDGHAAFEPRQRHADALVRPGNEGEVPVRGARNIEAVGIGKLRGIAIGGTDAKVDRCSGFQGNAADLAICGRHAIAELHRCIKAQHLVDRGAKKVGIVEQALPLLGVVEEEAEAIADEVGRRLVAGVEDEDAVLQQFNLGQPLAVCFARDQASEHIALVAGLFAPARDKRFEISAEFLDRAVTPREGLRRDHRLQRAENIERPLP